MLSHLIRHLPLLVFSSLAIQAMGDEFDDAIQEAMADLGLRGAAVTYFDKNTMKEPIARGYGRIASAKTATLVTADTAFQLASLSKPFVASAIAILVDRGEISLDDDICNVIPNNFSRTMCRNPNFPEEAITWRMLMTHRSSMESNLPEVKNESGDWIWPSAGPSNTYYTDYEDTGNPTCPLDEVVDFYHALLSDDPEAQTTVGAGVKLEDGEDLNWYELGESEGIWSDFQPGEENQYSNAAYGYLTALIELATGQSFPDFCGENLFAPLGMDTTAWFLEDLPDGTISAVPQEVNNKGKFSDIEPYCYIDYGSGSLHTTANDLVKWGNAMLTYGTQNLWSRTVGREISKCQERDENNERLDDECEFGYGWILVDNEWKDRRGRKLDTKKRKRRRLDEREDDDATFVPSSSDSSSTSEFNSESSTVAPSFSETSFISWSDSSEDSEAMWEEDRFESYDWTGGIMHDGSDAGVSTTMIVLPRAGVYVAVLLNSENDDDAVHDLMQTVVSAPIPPNSRLNGITNASMLEAFSSSSSGTMNRTWFSVTTVLMSFVLLSIY